MNPDRDRQDRIREASACPKCKHYGWSENMQPARARGHWHHPACPENSVLRPKMPSSVSAPSPALRGRK